MGGNGVASGGGAVVGEVASGGGAVVVGGAGGGGGVPGVQAGGAVGGAEGPLSGVKCVSTWCRIRELAASSPITPTRTFT